MSSKVLSVIAALLVAASVQAQELNVVQTPSMSGNYSAPQLTGCSMRPYPAKSAFYGEQGTIAMSVFLNANAKPTDVKVMKSSTWRELDKAAVGAIGFCTFAVEPAGPGDKPQGWIKVSYQWQMDAGDVGPELLAETCASRDGVAVGAAQNPAQNVKLRFHLTEEGKPIDIEKQPFSDSVEADLTARAIKFVQDCRYRPRTLAGKPVPGNASVVVQVKTNLVP